MRVGKKPKRVKDRRERCHTTRKVRWATEEEAKRQLELVKFFCGLWHKEQRVYLCKHCSGYHLTSQQKRGPSDA